MIGCLQRVVASCPVGFDVECLVHDIIMYLYDCRDSGQVASALRERFTRQITNHAYDELITAMRLDLKLIQPVNLKAEADGRSGIFLLGYKLTMDGWIIAEAAQEASDVA